MESYLDDLLPVLKARGHGVTVLSGGLPDARDVEGVVRTSALDALSLLGDRRLSGSTAGTADELIAKLVMQVRPEVIHVHNAHHFDASLSEAVHTHRPKRAAVFLGVHDRVGDRYDAAVLEHSWDEIIFASEYLARVFPTGRRKSVLHLGIDLARFGKPVRLHPRLATLSRPIIVHPARLLRWKGIDTSLRAFSKVNAVIPHASLVLPDVAGVADDEKDSLRLKAELKAEAAETGLSERVLFASFPRQEMASVYATADLVWYPTSDEEPFGLVPLEAMASGIPVVATRSGGIEETIKSGESGFLIEKSDSEALASASLSVLEDGEVRRRLVAGGRRRVRSFSLERHVKALEALYYGARATL